MRSSITIFLIGLALGSTLGIGGLWTQVVQPAYTQIKELNEEHAIMQSALDEAGETLQEVASSLRDEPVTGSSIAPADAPTPTQPEAETTQKRSRDPKVLAERLDRLALRVNRARARE